jgi:hypothetical protein
MLKKLLCKALVITSFLLPTAALSPSEVHAQTLTAQEREVLDDTVVTFANDMCALAYQGVPLNERVMFELANKAVLQSLSRSYMSAQEKESLIMKVQGPLGYQLGVEAGNQALQMCPSALSAAMSAY